MGAGVIRIDRRALDALTRGETGVRKDVIRNATKAVLELVDHMSRPRQFTIAATDSQQFSEMTLHHYLTQAADCRNNGV
jgi:hypothetical protein